MVDACEDAEFSQSFLLLVRRAVGCRIGTGDGRHCDQKAEVGVGLKQTQIANGLVVEETDRPATGLLIAAGGAEGAGVLGYSDAVEGCVGLGPSRQGSGERLRIGFGLLRGWCQGVLGGQLSGIGARLRLVEHGVASFAGPGSLGDIRSSGAVMGLGNTVLPLASNWYAGLRRNVKYLTASRR